MNSNRTMTVFSSLVALFLLIACTSAPAETQKPAAPEAPAATAPAPPAAPDTPEAPAAPESPAPAAAPEAAPAPAPPAQMASGDADAGKALFAKKCASCHGKSGEGNPTMAKMMKVELRNLGSAEAQEASDDDLAKIITEGKGKMKAIPGFSDADVDNLVAFLRSLKKTMM